MLAGPDTSVTFTIVQARPAPPPPPVPVYLILLLLLTHVVTLSVRVAGRILRVYNPTANKSVRNRQGLKLPFRFRKHCVHREGSGLWGFVVWRRCHRRSHTSIDRGRFIIFSRLLSLTAIMR